MFPVPRTIRHVVFAALFAGVGFLGIDDVAHCVGGGEDEEEEGEGEVVGLHFGKSRRRC